MKTFTLPDGRELIIPDDPNLRGQVGYAISQIPEYGPDVAKEYTEGTTIGQAIESFAGIPRGIAGATLKIARGGVEALAQDSLGEGPLVRLADKMKATEERVVQNIAGYKDPRYADAYTVKAGEAFGSIIPFATIGGLAGQGAKYVPMMKPGTKGFGKVNPLNFNAKFLKSKPFLYTGAAGASSYMAQNADMTDIAVDVYGEDKPGFFAENLSTLTSGVIGVSEALPIFNFFKSIPKSALRDAPTSAKIFNHARNFTAGFVQEGLQESTAGLLQDLNARGFYSDELPIGDSLFDDFTVGGFAGGALNTILQGYGGRRGIASEYRAEKEKRAEQKKQDLLKTKKFDIAQQQGVINIADPTLDDSVEEALLLPLLDDIPKPVEVSTAPQLQIRKNQNNTFSLIDNNLGEVNSFTKEVDAIKEKEKLLKDYEVNEETQILNNDLYILGLNKSPQAYELGQTVIDNDTTTASLKEIVPYDTSLKTPEAMQKVLMGTNKKYKNLPLKENYTFEEVKKILSKKDFNNFVTDTSQQVAVVSNSKNIPSVIENNNKTNVTIGRLKEIGNAKNININVNSPAFEYAAKRWTGTSSFKAMTKPQKELLLARIQSIPRFNTKVDFPNLQPRMYSAQEVADTVTNLKKDNVLFNQKSLGMMGIKDPQFFEDLVYSGRAEKVKGNQYKIADNFQEKIDSRAGAFNETTEEFVNRLVTEGRLSPEAISQLEQEQKITESQQLPPKEEAQKTIDFAESVQQGKTNKFAQELRKRLARIGLKETGVVVSNDILSTSALLEKPDGSIEFQGIDETTEGEYDRQTDIIFISLNAVNPDGKATDAEIQRKLNEVLDHELIHALREKDLITEKEYDYLKKQVKKKRVPKSVDAIAFNKKETYYDRAIRINKRTFDEKEQATRTKAPVYFSPATKEELYTEEAIAEMYRNRRVESPLPEKAEGIYNKIIEFFAEVGESLRISGFDNANQIFDQIQAGRVGKRARDKIRTTKLLDKGAAPIVGEMLDEVDDDYLDTPLFARRGPRDETSGHLADYVPAQYGPPAHDLNAKSSKEEFTPEGYSTFSAAIDYNKLQDFSTQRENLATINRVIDSAPTRKEGLKIIKENPDYQNMLLGLAEEVDFLRKLQEIKGNPNAEITMYQAAPQRDLREGDLITPFLSEANLLVEDSKVTREEIREADRARRRQEQIDKTGAVDLQQEKLYNQMDKAFDIGGPFPDRTPSKVHTFKLRAGDVRWDGNGGWARWGYFPRLKAVEDIPTFSRTTKEYPTTQKQINTAPKEILEESLNYHNQLLFEKERERTVDATILKDWEVTKLNRAITNTSAIINKTKQRLKELDDGIQPPLFSRGRRDNETPSKALEEVIETVNNTARGGIPVYNLNASDTALEAAKEYIEDEAALLPGDIPNYSKIAPTLDGVDASIREGIKQTGSQTSPQNSMGYRFIDVAKDNISGAIEYFYNNFREQLIDKADKAQKEEVKMSEENEKVRRLNNTADTSTMAAIRLMDRARGLFQGMLNTGYISSTIQGIDSLSNTKQLTISTKYNPFIDGDTGTGGLMQILAPLYGTPTDLESIFKYYALLKRKKGFDKSGRNIETPITQKNLNDIRKIESTYPQVVEAYQNYQRWNNKLIKFAVDKGLLSKTRNVSELARDISAITKEDENDLLQLSYEELMNKANVLNRTLTLDKQIETRGTAEIWATNSDYYPFYRKMTDDTIAGPNIANGSLPNNPLNIKIEGSAKQIDVDVIEAISRNSLAILTAALKNDGSAKLIRDMEIYGSAKEITPIEISKNPKLKNNLDVVTVFENGLKKYYQVENVEAFNVFKEVGGTPSGLMTTVFGGFASTLRDTVTRDPGFVMVNLLRDSLSTMVTSGANYTPVLDTFKNMIADMSELERFGVIGGYDFQNDEGSIKRYIKRNMRLSGLTEENGMSAKKAFFMVWDGLGDLTTKSDGATRLAVYNAIYDKLKKEGYNEAQAQSEAAFQALEIINFGRRGANPGFRFITAAIPFLNARVQGLDVLWRSSTGQYSAAEKLGENETIKEVQKRIQLNMAQNAGALIALTLAYYLMYHDDEEYKNLKREVRDDNWVFPIAKDFAIKIPIPFEVGLLFKVIPERVFDMTMGDDAFTRKSVDEAMKTIGRGTQTSLNIPFFQPGGGFQLLKPISEVLNNRNTFTGQEIVPYYQQKKAPGLQARPTTNFLVKEISEYFNISPAKVEHVIRGYTGTLGGHVLNLIDVTARGVTGENILPSNVSLNRIPLFNRVLMNTDQAGGLQQQFYELRTEVDGAVQTINDLKNKGRMDEYNAYRNSMQGVLNVKGQVRKMERYLTKWRKRRDAILRNKNISLTAKQDALERLELERDRRLAMVPELRKRANIPITHMGTF